MDAFYIPWNGIVTDADNATDALTEARAWLVAHDVTSGDADAMIADYSSANNTAAHWGGHDVGFVQAHHEGAQPVWVVGLPQGYYLTHPDPITD